MSDSANQNRSQYRGSFTSGKEPLGSLKERERSGGPNGAAFAEPVEAPVGHTMYHIIDASDPSKLTLREMDPFAAAAAYQELRQTLFDSAQLADARCPMAKPSKAASSLANEWMLQRRRERQGGWV
jgi:hypothetical protein